MNRTLSLTYISLLLAATLFSCSGVDWDEPGHDGEERQGVCRIEWAGTKSGGDYITTTYRIIAYGQPNQYINEYVYVADGSYCNPANTGTHLGDSIRHWLTPCRIRVAETAPGSKCYRYLHDGDSIPSGLVFSNYAQYTNPKDGKKYYCSYNQKSFRMVIASAAIPVTKYSVTVRDGEREYQKPCQALVIRRDIGDGDSVAVSPVLDVDVQSSYAGNGNVEYIYTLPNTILTQQRSKISVSIECDRLLAGATVGGARLINVADSAYYLPDTEQYDEERVFITENPASLERVFPVPIEQTYESDTIFPYGGEDVYLISKDYGATRTDSTGRVISACVYPSLEVKLGETWIPIKLNVDMLPQHHYHINVMISNVHVTARMHVLPWDTPLEEITGSISEYPIQYVGEMTPGIWDPISCTFTVDGSVAGMEWTRPSGVGNTTWTDGGNLSGVIGEDTSPEP